MKERTHASTCYKNAQRLVIYKQGKKFQIPKRCPTSTQVGGVGKLANEDIRVTIFYYHTSIKDAAFKLSFRIKKH